MNKINRKLHHFTWRESSNYYLSNRSGLTLQHRCCPQELVTCILKTCAIACVFSKKRKNISEWTEIFHESMIFHGLPQHTKSHKVEMPSWPLINTAIIRHTSLKTAMSMQDQCIYKKIKWKLEGERKKHSNKNRKNEKEETKQTVRRAREREIKGRGWATLRQSKWISLTDLMCILFIHKV